LDPKNLNELGRQGEEVPDYKTYVSETSGSFSGLVSKIKMRNRWQRQKNWF